MKHHVRVALGVGLGVLVFVALVLVLLITVLWRQKKVRKHGGSADCEWAGGIEGEDGGVEVKHRRVSELDGEAPASPKSNRVGFYGGDDLSLVPTVGEMDGPPLERPDIVEANRAYQNGKTRLPHVDERDGPEKIPPPPSPPPPRPLPEPESPFRSRWVSPPTGPRAGVRYYSDPRSLAVPSLLPVETAQLRLGETRVKLETETGRVRAPKARKKPILRHPSGRNAAVFGMKISDDDDTDVDDEDSDESCFVYEPNAKRQPNRDGTQSTRRGTYQRREGTADARSTEKDDPVKSSEWSHTVQPDSGMAPWKDEGYQSSNRPPSFSYSSQGLDEIDLTPSFSLGARPLPSIELDPEMPVGVNPWAIEFSPNPVIFSHLKDILPVDVELKTPHESPLAMDTDPSEMPPSSCFRARSMESEVDPEPVQCNMDDTVHDPNIGGATARQRQIARCFSIDKEGSSPGDASTLDSTKASDHSTPVSTFASPLSSIQSPEHVNIVDSGVKVAAAETENAFCPVICPHCYANFPSESAIL